MYYVVESDKSFEQAVADLEKSVKDGKFGVLHVHDLGETLRSKGIDFTEQCKILEVCNPVAAAEVLAKDMRLNMALPCRISVYTERGKTRIGVIKPAQMLSTLSDAPELGEIASQVENKIIHMIDSAR